MKHSERPRRRTRFAVVGPEAESRRLMEHGRAHGHLPVVVPPAGSAGRTRVPAASAQARVHAHVGNLAREDVDVVVVTENAVRTDAELRRLTRALRARGLDVIALVPARAGGRGAGSAPTLLDAVSPADGAGVVISGADKSWSAHLPRLLSGLGRGASTDVVAALGSAPDRHPGAVDVPEDSDAFLWWRRDLLRGSRPQVAVTREITRHLGLEPQLESVTVEALRAGAETDAARPEGCGDAVIGVTIACSIQTCSGERVDSVVTRSVGPSPRRATRTLSLSAEPARALAVSTDDASLRRGLVPLQHMAEVIASGLGAP